jgi:phosphatidylserine decarboxylase
VKTTYWHREKKCEEIEQVYGDRFVRWLYETAPGLTLADRLLTKRWFSRLYGIYQASPLSRRKIRPFVDDFKITMEEFEETPYGSFNDFFIRKFKPGKRSFVTAPHLLPAFSEARYLAFERMDENIRFPVKGSLMGAMELLAVESKAGAFMNGPVVIARLAPVDYHRFHYPDDGQTIEEYRVHGNLHSVNPLALKSRGEVFSTNERQVSILKTENFGKLAYIEVGALCVGKIVQSHPPQTPFKRGDEKGYFLFGASTVILLGQPGAWKPDADILERTARAQETYIKLGERIASK